MRDDYALLTEATAIAHLRRRPAISARIDAGTARVSEIGDGNLNLVFVCRDDGGRSLVLKQSIPYVRAAGPSWPLTADRSHAEARGLAAAFGVSPSTSVELFDYDRDHHIVAMEDLSRLRTWRAVLNDDGVSEGAADACGRHLARLLLGTGTFGRHAHEVREEMASAGNPALCRITEDLVFTEPYIDHPHNRYDPAIADVVAALRSDPRVLDAVSRLKFEFTTRTDALVHGDLHTGSVMVGDRPSVETKVIDAEFCFPGPIAYDLGTLLGNVLTAAARATCTKADRQRAWLDTVPGELWAAFTEEFWGLWPRRDDRSLTDASAQQHLDRIARDAVGFAACEAIRRVVGFAKVRDVETLPPAVRAHAARMVLEIARGWLVHPVPAPELRLR